MPVGFKWFVDPLFSGEVAFGGGESSGMSFLRKRTAACGPPIKGWSDPRPAGRRITAKTGRAGPASPGAGQALRRVLVQARRHPRPTLEPEAKFAKLTGDDVAATQLAGDITAK